LIEAYFPVPTSWSGKWQRAALAATIRPAIKPNWNNLGGVTDGCNGIVWVDDRQIVEGAVVKQHSDRPRLVVSVWAASEPSAWPRSAEVTIEPSYRQ
jgi:Holliday junction resolvase RusA-like endonuclease